MGKRATTQFVAGALIRRTVRRELLGLADRGVRFQEEKGLLDSQFVVSGPERVIDALNTALLDAIHDRNKAT